MAVVTVPPGVIERIVEVLDPEEVWLFGSRAKGTHRPDSDVDLGIILTEGGDALGAYTVLVPSENLIHLDSRREAELSHHQVRCSRSCIRS